jgi:hypothetical protein
MRASQTSLGGDEQERELKAQPKSEALTIPANSLLPLDDRLRILRGAPAAMACYLACI